MFGIPVGKLQGAISSKEFTEYKAYYSTRPLPQDRTETYLAQIAWWVWKSNSDKFRGNYKLTDFIYDWDDEPQRQTDAQMREAAMSLCSRVVKRGKHQQDSGKSNS